MTLSDRPIRGGQLDPVVIAGYIDANGDIVPETDLITITEDWSLRTIFDTDLNDSNKSITVPAGQEWQILWVYVALATSATVGNRQMTLRIVSSGGTTFGSIRAGATQAASLTRYYMFAPSLADLLAFRDTNFLMTPIPPTLFLSAGQQLQILDSGAIDAAADDMSVYVQLAWRSV